MRQLYRLYHDSMVAIASRHIGLDIVLLQTKNVVSHRVDSYGREIFCNGSNFSLFCVLIPNFATKIINKLRSNFFDPAQKNEPLELVFVLNFLHFSTYLMEGDRRTNPLTKEFGEQPSLGAWHNSKTELED